MYRPLAVLVFALLALPRAAAPVEPLGEGGEDSSAALDFLKAKPAQTVSAGKFVRVYDPSQGESERWYINDHTFVRAADGTWHLFGITHPEPGDPQNEIQFAHATAPSLQGPWTKQPFALEVDPSYGETHLWAPHVVENDGTYYMFFNGGGADQKHAQIELATSTDLFEWTRLPSGRLFTDGFQARDPMVLRVGDHWVMYYEATTASKGGHFLVAYRTSDDLVHWSARGIAYTSARTGTWASDTESPFVVARGGSYYLFIGPCGAYAGRYGYTCTDVYRSQDPLHFQAKGKVGRILSHAAEAILDEKGRWFVSHAGWGQGGVYLAPLSW